MGLEYSAALRAKFGSPRLECRSPLAPRCMSNAGGFSVFLLSSHPFLLLISFKKDTSLTALEKSTDGRVQVRLPTTCRVSEQATVSSSPRGRGEGQRAIDWLVSEHTQKF